MTQIAKPFFDLGACASALVVTVLLGTPPAQAAKEDWEIHRYKDGSLYLRLKAAPDTKEMIMRDPDGARLVDAKPHERFKQIEVVEYDAGEHGTQQMTRVFHAVLYNTVTKKILGDFPLRYESRGGKKQPEQPKWTTEDHAIKIFVPDSGDTYTVKVD